MFKKVLVHTRRGIKFTILFMIAAFLIVGIIAFLYKPTYSVFIKGEQVGYTGDRTKLQHKINDYVENGGNYVDDGSSTVGKMIKVLAIIVLVLSVIGSFVIMGQLGAPIGIASLIVSVLTSLLAYGIGEIVCVLREINDKIK